MELTAHGLRDRKLLTQIARDMQYIAISLDEARDREVNRMNYPRDVRVVQR